MGVPRHAKFVAPVADETRDMLERSQVAGIRQWMLDHDVAVRVAGGELDGWIRPQQEVERVRRCCVTRGEAHDGVARSMLGAQPVPRAVLAFTRDDPVGEQQTHRRLRGAQRELRGGGELGQAGALTTLSQGEHEVQRRA